MTISYSHKLDHSPTLQGERLLLEPNRISANSTTIETVVLGRKHITSLLSDEKKDKKLHQASRRHYIAQYQRSASRRRDHYFIIKL